LDRVRAEQQARLRDSFLRLPAERQGELLGMAEALTFAQREGARTVPGGSRERAVVVERDHRKDSPGAEALGNRHAAGEGDARPRRGVRFARGGAGRLRFFL